MVTQTGREFLLFSIGPVQSFIGAARRTQDLWLGSQLLSNLAEVGVAKADTLGTVIFPVQIDNRWPNSVPNRFVVSVANGKGTEVATAITEVVKVAWMTAAIKVQSYFDKLAPENSWAPDWTRQAEDWLEIYWSVWPEGDNYTAAYGQASMSLDARKQIRHIPASAEPGETCSLCGMRQALHGHRDHTRAVAQFWATVRRHPEVTGAELRPNEQLCTICTVKRFAAKAGAYIGRNLLTPTDRFPSTSSVAVAAFKGQLITNWEQIGPTVLAHLDAIDGWGAGSPYAHAELSPYLNDLTEGNPEAGRLLYYDGDFFYPESLAAGNLEDLLGRSVTSNDTLRAQGALRTLKRLLNQAKAIGIAPPPTYFSVLMMDGDHMGKKIGQSNSIGRHQQLSDTLARFAEVDVPRVIEQEFAGRVVYAGGDDTLALLPIEHALAASNQLRLAFTRAMTGVGLNDLTASGGLAFGHRTFPLGATLEAARRAEHQAKEKYERNALAVEVIRRSGAWDQIGTKWQFDNVDNETLTILTNILTAMTGGELSGKFAYDVEKEASALDGVPAAQEKELSRLLTRHWQGQPIKAYEATIAEMAKQLAELCEVGRIGIVELSRWLLLLRFLIQGEEE